jgi:hypothetical protein
MLYVALMLSLHGTRHVRTSSHAEIVALPLPPAPLVVRACKYNCV